MERLIFAVVILTIPAFALDQPVPWRDPDSGCAYWLTPQGAIAPRYRSDGQPACPDDVPRGAGAPIVSDQAIRDMTRELGRALEALRREVERLQGELHAVRQELERRR